MNIFFLILILILSAILSISIIYINRLLGNKYIDNLEGVQKFHNAPTPRLGGLAIFLAFIFSSIVASEYKEVYLLLVVSSTPIFFVGILEDLYKNINPRNRLLSAFVSGILFVLLTGYSIKNIDFLNIDNLLSIYFVSLIFTSFAISGIVNSINIIDGFHGLASGSLIIMFSAFAFIGWEIGDYLIFNLSITSIVIFMGFFIINFPFGYIFLGDAGAYFGGFLLSSIAIILPSRNPDISAWLSFLVCIYPITETLFSIYRKIRRKGHHPSKPDRVHLHMLIYRNISRRISKKMILENHRNSITSVILWFYPLSTSIIAVMVYKYVFATIIFILIMPIAYIILYKKVSLNW